MLCGESFSFDSFLSLFYRISLFQQWCGGPLWFLIIFVINNKLDWFMPVMNKQSSLEFLLSFIVSSSLDVAFVTSDKRAATAMSLMSLSVI
jgi:hypothetical protein